jgi:protein phosphatase
MRVRSYALSDIGRVRASNEDHFAVAELAQVMNIRWTNVPQALAQYSSHRGHLFLVADGVGGHQGGEVASALTVLTVEAFLLNTLKGLFRLKAAEEAAALREFRESLLRADARILDEAADRPELAGMATTLTLAFAADWKLFVAHAGDSRCYLYSGGKLTQETLDHTVAADLLRVGVISAAEAAGHPRRHVITNALGGREPGVRTELHRIELEPGDVLLLCSDGLTDMLADPDIAAVLREECDPRRACERLVAEANERGGKDNITAVVAAFAGA